MGISTNGMLVYGYNLGGDEGGWKVKETDEYDCLTLPWWDDDSDDFASEVEARLLASVGFTEEWSPDSGYYDRKRAAQAKVHVSLESYCSGEYPMWILAAHEITVWRGDVKVIDFDKLQTQAQAQDWDAKLSAAIDALGITPLQAFPEWLLVSYMG